MTTQELWQIALMIALVLTSPIWIIFLMLFISGIAMGLSVAFIVTVDYIMKVGSSIKRFVKNIF